MIFRPSSRAAVLALFGVAVVATTGLVAQGGPQDDNVATAKLVATMVEKFHISHHQLDDDVSRKVFNKYLSDLDPMKLYFLQSDIDEFSKYETKLDDLVKQGNSDFAYMAFDRYLQRMKQRIATAQKLIDSDFDFTVDESMVTDAKQLPWAASAAELDERWRKRIKYDVLSLKLDSKPTGNKPADQLTPEDRKNQAVAGNSLPEIRERLHKRYRNIETTAGQTDASEKLELYLSAVTHSFDPHSSYMSPNTLDDFRISMELSLEGIGAALRSEDGYTVVAEVVPGGAADKDGRLKAGDKIIGVAQASDKEFTDIVEMKLTRVVRLIRGDKATVVRLQVKTAENGEIKVYDLTRQKIELTSSAVRGEIIDSGERIGVPGYRIGVISIPSFYRDFRGAQAGVDNFKSTSRDVLEVLKNFRDEGGVDGIVIDLRFNGGGALAEAIEVTGLFIDQGPVVQVKEQDGSVRSHDDVDQSVAYSGPLMVICNRLSASASEIFAAAIRDYNRGIVVGDTTTHGKGTVQNVMPVPPQLLQFLTSNKERGALKLTINQFYRVNGDSTQNVGVPSDVVLPSVLDHLDLGEQFLDNALAFDRVPAARFRTVDGLIPQGILPELRERSVKRLADNKDFKDLETQILKLIERKKDKVISLNEAKRKADREEAEKADSPEKDIAEEATAHGPIFPKTYYNDELLHLASDYLSLLKTPKTAKR